MYHKYCEYLLDFLLSTLYFDGLVNIIFKLYL